MAEQIIRRTTRIVRSTPAIVWLLGLAALVLMVDAVASAAQTRDWAIIAMILAIIELGWISRAYTVKLQDRIIMLEMKVRCRRAPAGRAGRAAGEAVEQADRRAALRVGRGAWRAARARRP